MPPSIPPATDSRRRPSAPHDHRALPRPGTGGGRGRLRGAAAAADAGAGFVLETLLGSHRALTAYELFEGLAAAGLGSGPPVVYRALDFLVANGFVHRIERLGAFAACTLGGAEHVAGFLVCRACRRVAEISLPRPVRGLAGQAAAAGFAIERTVVEAEGLCARCREATAVRRLIEAQGRGCRLRRAPGADRGEPGAERGRDRHRGRAERLGQEHAAAPLDRGGAAG